jgi:hypothetical protein
MTAKRILAFAIFVWGTAAIAVAQSTSHIGAWSINTTFVGDKSVVLLQTPALARDENGKGDPDAATLNVICKQGRLSAVAIHTTFGVDRHAVSDAAAVPTIRVVSMSEGHIATSEKWAVSERGHTFSPYSEVSQGQLNRYWLERLTGARTLTVQLGGSEATFDTEQLSSAMLSVGCRN